MIKSAHTESVSAGAKGVGNLAYIDMLRGLAILGVLVVHFTTFGMRAARLEQLPMHIDLLMQAGRHGVTLFFVVSAFTLMRSMHIRIDEEHMPMRKYFLRRFFRIAPTYYLVLIVAYFYFDNGYPDYSNPQDRSLTWPDLATHMLFINGLFPFYSNNILGIEWSVSTEFMFYMLLPFLFIWLNKMTTTYHLTINVGSLYIASIVLYWGMYFKGEVLQEFGGGFVSPVFKAWNYFFIATHLQAFVAGIGVWAIIHKQNRNYSTTVNRQLAIFALIWLVFAATAGAYVEGYKVMSSEMVWGSLIFWGILSAALIYLLDLLRPDNILGLVVLSVLGRISFSLYLVHFPIGEVLGGSLEWWQISNIAEINFLLYEIIALILSCFVAWLLFHIVEKPGMKLGQVLIRRFSA